MKTIIGFVGQAGSGKGTAANHLRLKNGAAVFTFSDFLHGILDLLHLPPSRDNLIKLSTALRQGLGQDVLANAMEKQVDESRAELVVVDGIRRPEDIEDLKKNPAFHLVEIVASPETRFARLKQRSDKPGETSMTWEDFLAMSQRETEITIAGVAKQAEISVDNSGDIPDLENALEQLITKLNSTTKLQ
jgi:dephospho-CoA kinase